MTKAKKKSLPFKGKRTFRNKKTGERVVIEANVTQQRRKGKRDYDSLKFVGPYRIVSLTGDIYTKHASHPHSLGQIDEDLNPQDFEDHATMRRILSIWTEWHLNDMQAATKRQQKAFEKSRAKDYESRVAFLKKKKMYDDRGYKYGTDWLLKKVPAKVVNEIMEIFSGGKK